MLKNFNGPLQSILNENIELGIVDILLTEGDLKIVS